MYGLKFFILWKVVQKTLKMLLMYQAKFMQRNAGVFENGYLKLDT